MSRRGEAAGPVCTCAACRRTIREAILEACERRGRWTGYYTARVEAELGWVPSMLYYLCFAELVRDGLMEPIGVDPAGIPWYRATGPGAELREGGAP